VDHTKVDRIETALTGLGYRQVTGVRSIGGGCVVSPWIEDVTGMRIPEVDAIVA
jgi:hypothetical protein